MLFLIGVRVFTIAVILIFDQNQHEVEKDAPHVGVTIALATNSELQERGAVLNRLTVKLVVDRNRAEVWRKR